MSVLTAVNRPKLSMIYTSIVKSLNSELTSSKSSNTEFSSTKHWKVGLTPTNENGFTFMGFDTIIMMKFGDDLI